MPTRSRHSIARPRVDGIDSPACSLDLGDDDKGFFVARNGKIVLRDRDQSAARGGLLVECLRRSAPERQWLACLHASAICRNDRALVFSGGCGVGKTTLTLGMLHAGWRLIADDMLPIDREDHALWPLPFGMSLKEGSFALAERLFPETEAIPALSTDRGPVRYFFPEGRARLWAEGGLPASTLIFPRFEVDAELEIQPMAAAQALQQLVTNGSAIDLTGCHLDDFLEWLETAACYSLTYGDLDAAVETLGAFAPGASSNLAACH